MYFTDRLVRRGFCLVFVFLTAVVCLGASAEKTKYSDKANRELKQDAVRLAKNIRELIRFYERKDRDLRSEYDRKSRPQADGRERELRERWLEETDTLHDATMQRYKQQYWSDAILVADEIHRRLPKKARQANVAPIYQQPTNILGVRVIADDLEKIAKSLPD